MKITNSIGCRSHAPLLVVEEYDHWKVRMKRVLVGKENGEEIWRSVKKGPHVPVRQVVWDVVSTIRDQEETWHAPLIVNDIDKLKAYPIAFSEMVFDVLPSCWKKSDPLQLRNRIPIVLMIPQIRSYRRMILSFVNCRLEDQPERWIIHEDY